MGVEHDETLQAPQTDDDGEGTDARSARAVERSPSLRDGELPTRIDRFLVIERLGSGGMGVVLAAYDPQLDRRVAIKLVRTFGDDPSRNQQRRLLREARALARVSHPNVIAVFEVGTHEGDVFIAMELVDGETLDAFACAPGRDRREIIEAYLEAGEGLAAAHRSGLVHRDFKPQNVLVGRDGRVRVLDFGLVRHAEEGETDVSRATMSSDAIGVEDADGGPSRDVITFDADDALRTKTDAVLGTPAYMSLEQLMGKPADARSDQFSFCVSLYEALHGQRPFRGASLGALAAALMHDRVRSPPKGSQVPAKLRRVVVRGLAAQPEARWPSMDVLLAELRRVTSPPRIWPAALVGVGAVTVIALGAWPRPEAPRPCAGIEAELQGVWDDARREAIADAFRATSLPYADDAMASVTAALDAYTQRWVGLRTDICEATRVRGDQSEALMDLRTACADEALRNVTAFSDALVHADADVVENAVTGAQQLPRVDGCATIEPSQSQVVPRDLSIASEVDRVRTLVAQSKAHLWTGKYHQGKEIADAALQAAEATGFGPVLAEVQEARGVMLTYLGEPQRAREAFEQALYAAAASGDEELEAHVLVSLASASAGVREDLDEALHRIRLAEALAQHLGSPRYLMGTVLHVRARVLDAAGRHEEALEQLRIAADPARGYAEDDPKRMSLANDLAMVLGQQGRYQESIEAIEVARARAERELGPWHPEVGRVHMNMSVSYANLEQAEPALRHAQHALEIYERTLGPDNIETGRTHHNIGVAHELVEDHAAALESYRRALEIKTASLGPDHPTIAYSATSMGSTLVELGRADEAIAHFDDALRIWSAALGPDAAINLYPLNGLVGAYLELDRPERAVEPSRRALALAEAGEVEPVVVARARFLAARVVLRTRGDRAEALALAELAQAGYRDAERPSTDELAEIEAWLEANDLRPTDPP